MNPNEQLPTADNTSAQSNNSSELNIEPSDQQLDPSSDLLLDEFLMTALRSVKDRPALLKIELEIERFVQDTSQSHVTFPPMSSYHRLMVHKVAHHWGLQHLTGVTAGSGPQPAKYVRVERGAVTSSPLFKLRELCESDVSSVTPVNTTPAPTPVTAPVKVSPGPVKLLLRRNMSTEAKNNTAPSGTALPNQASASRDQASDSTNQNSPSLEEREAAYAKARARIFSEQQALENAAANNINNSVNGSSVNNGSVNGINNNTAVSAINSNKGSHEDDEWYDSNDLPNWEEDEAAEYRRDLSARCNPSVSHVTRPALVEQLDRLQLNDTTRVTSVKPATAPMTRVNAPSSTQEQVAKLGHILEVTGLTDLTSAPYLEVVNQLKDVATIKQLPNKEGQPLRVVAIFGNATQAQNTMTSFNARNNSVKLQTMTARVTPVNVSFNSQAPNKSVNRPVNPRPAPNPAYSQPYYPNPAMTPVNQGYPYQQYYPNPMMTPVNQGYPVNYHPAMYAQYPPNAAPNPAMYPPYYYPNPQYYTNTAPK